jgi:hypothetical protein
MMLPPAIRHHPPEESLVYPMKYPAPLDSILPDYDLMHLCSCTKESLQPVPVRTVSKTPLTRKALYPPSTLAIGTTSQVTVLPSPAAKLSSRAEVYAAKQSSFIPPEPFWQVQPSSASTTKHTPMHTQPA